MNQVTMQNVCLAEKMEFLTMAQQHFLELNPEFAPERDWREHYLEGILANKAMYLRWICVVERRVGFVLYGVEPHRFLPRRTGMIYELYIQPEYRRRGVAKVAASLAIAELIAQGVSKVQLEIMDGNVKAEALWRSLDFVRVSARYVLKGR